MGPLVSPERKRYNTAGIILGIGLGGESCGHHLRVPAPPLNGPRSSRVIQPP